MGWYKKAQSLSNDNYGYWIGPDGKSHDVYEEAAHFNVLLDLGIDKMMDNYDQWANNPRETEVYDQAFKNGYVKVTMPLGNTQNNVLFIDFQTKLNSAQIEVLSNIINYCYAKEKGNCNFQICKYRGMKRTNDPKEAILALY
jgi:hypothetical protein